MSKKDLLHKAVIAHKDELLSLVSQLIQIPSENPGGTQEDVIQFIENYLRDGNIPSQRVAKNPDHPCLLAEVGEADGFHILCNGHVDVVPAGARSGWNFDPFSGEIKDTVIRGRGTSDMKAGVAILLFIMKLFAQCDTPLGGSIRLHLVSDEETGGEFGTSFLCSEGYASGADVCVVAEPTSNDNIEIGQKGICHLTLKATGTPAHGSIGNYVGDNAITKLSRVLQHIGNLTAVPGHFDESQAQALENSKIIAARSISPAGASAIDHLTANVGVISGGTKINMVPDYCEAKVDMRLPIGTVKEEVISAVEAMIAQSGVTGVEAVFDWKAEPNFTPYDSPVVSVFHKNAEAIWNNKVLPAYQWASSDAGYYRNLGIPTIQFGPANLSGIHSYNEDVDILDVIHSAEIYMLSFCDLLGIE